MTSRRASLPSGPKLFSERFTDCSVVFRKSASDNLSTPLPTGNNGASRKKASHE